MIMPSYSTLPESMLAPSQVHEKFNSRTLSGLQGLGCGCKILDEDGSCWDPEPCGSTSTGGSGTSSGSWWDLVDSSPTVKACPGGWLTTGTCSADDSYSSSTGSDLTPAQKASLDAQILQGGFNIAKLLAVQPGTTLNANGAISQQNPGYPIQTLGAQVGTSGLGSSAVVIALIAAGAFFLSQRGR